MEKIKNQKRFGLITVLAVILMLCMTLGLTLTTSLTAYAATVTPTSFVFRNNGYIWGLDPSGLTTTEKQNIAIVLPASYEYKGNQYDTLYIAADSFCTIRTPKVANTEVDYTGCVFVSVDLSAATKLTTIGSRAFKGNSSLTGTLTLPAAVRSIGRASFEGTRFTTVNLPNTPNNDLMIYKGDQYDGGAFDKTTCLIVAANKTQRDFYLNNTTDNQGGLSTYGSRFIYKTNSPTLFLYPANGVTMEDPLISALGSSIAVPTKEGSKFLGWYDRSGAQVTDDAGTFLAGQKPTAETILTAKWEDSKYITYDMGGHGTQIEQQKVTNGSNTVAPTAPEEAGYEFSGWFTEANGAGTEFIFGSTLADNVTIFAKWTAKTNTAYTVKHLQQNIENDNYTQVDIENLTGTTATDTAAVAKTTYTGFTAKTVTQAKIAGDGSTVVEIKYDRNLFDVTYMNGDTLAQKFSVRYGDVVPAYSAATPTKAQDDFKSYSFDRWEGDDTGTVSAARTFTAVFTDTARTYLVTLNANDGAINAGSITEYTAGTGAMLPTDVTKTSKGFDGWYDNSGLAGTAVTQITATDFGNKEYFAKWIDGYTVTYDEQGGSDVENKLVIMPKNTVEALPEAPTKIGYRFDGWFTEVNGGGSEFTKDTTVNSAITVYAKWTAKTDTAYTVEHYQQNILDNEYTKITADTENKTGTTATNTAAVAKTYTGFTAKTFAQATINAEGNTVIKIYYDREVYTVKYMNGDAEVQKFENVKYGAATPACTEANPVKAADDYYTYAFKAWETDATVTADKSYVAEFNRTAKTYGVTLNVNGGTLASTLTTYTAASATELPVPTKDGCVFRGWFVAADCTGTAVTTITATDFGTKTFYAKWFSAAPVTEGETHGVAIEAEKGLDPNAKLVVGTVEITKEIKNIDLTEATGKNTKVAAVFTIDIKLNDTEIQPDGKLKITIDIPEGIKGESGYQIVYIDDNNVAHKYDSTVSGDKITFTTDHLSNWAIVVDGSYGLSGGAIAGIVIGSVVLLLAAAYACGYFFLYKKGKLDGKAIAVIYGFLKK